MLDHPGICYINNYINMLSCKKVDSDWLRDIDKNQYYTFMLNS